LRCAVWQLVDVPISEGCAVAVSVQAKKRIQAVVLILHASHDEFIVDLERVNAQRCGAVEDCPDGTRSGLDPFAKERFPIGLVRHVARNLSIHSMPHGIIRAMIDQFICLVCGSRS
jgi:hypothetical protein